MVLDIFNSSVELGLEVAVVIFAKQLLVRCVASAFKHFAANLGLEC